jgi:hypothetical protein
LRESFRDFKPALAGQAKPEARRMGAKPRISRRRNCRPIEAPGNISDVMQSFCPFLAGNELVAHLTMMAPCLVKPSRDLHRSETS